MRATVGGVPHILFRSVARALARATAALDFAGQRLGNIGAPTQAGDAATKTYVDALINGWSVKEPVRVATTANITLSGEQTIDGVAVAAGDRVLARAQSTGAQNGIYICAAGAWSRATDCDADAEVESGLYVLVKEGTTYADSAFALTTDGAITVGTTALTFTEVAGLNKLSVSSPLSKSGNALSVITNPAFTGAVGSTTGVFQTTQGTGSATVRATNALGTAVIGVISDTLQALAVGATTKLHSFRTGGTEHLAVGLGGRLIATQLTAPTSDLTGTVLNDGGSSDAALAVAVGSTDLAGSITVLAGNGTPGAGLAGKVVFNTAYPAAPKAVLLTPRDADAAGDDAYVPAAGITTTGFEVHHKTALAASEAREYSYLVIG